MIERDDELQRLLRQWEAPPPRPQLDARVWSSCRKRTSLWRWKKWLPIAAGVVLAVGIARFWQSGSGASIETRMDAMGFRPIANGAITVITNGEKR